MPGLNEPVKIRPDNIRFVLSKQFSRPFRAILFLKQLLNFIIGICYHGVHDKHIRPGAVLVLLSRRKPTRLLILRGSLGRLRGCQHLEEYLLHELFKLLFRVCFDVIYDQPNLFAFPCSGAGFRLGIGAKRQAKSGQKCKIFDAFHIINVDERKLQMEAVSAIQPFRICIYVLQSCVPSIDSGNRTIG